MNLSKYRIQFNVAWMALLVGAVILPIFADQPHRAHAAAQTSDPKVVLHILNRLSFGPAPGDMERVESIGVECYIQEQLSPLSIPEPQNLTEQLSQLNTLHMTPGDLVKEYRPQPVPKNAPQPSVEAKKAAREKERIVLRQAIQARLLQATQSHRQLQEVMVNFWYNHFNVYNDKGLDRLWIGTYEQEAIRPHALGHFRDLLEATARHPAMLYYLDNWQNTDPNSPGARGRFKGLNENYARELMELHTLGVDNGYTQQDVITLAKIFTGWGLSGRNQNIDQGYGFYFDAKRHDFSDKVFLGYAIKGSGMAEGEQALDILAKSPATARHISYQLAQYFVTDQPPQALVDRLTQKYLSSDGDIRVVLDALFHSPEFGDAKYYNAKFKTPYEYAVSAVRATGIEANNFTPIAGLMQQLGMPLYGYLTPDGYKNTADAWLNPDAITRRITFATALASGRLRLAAPTSNDKSAISPTNEQLPPQPVDATQLANTLGNLFSPNTQQTLASSPPQLRAALILGSPEFMQR